MELIESAVEGEHKMLLFSQFTSMLDVLKKDLDKAGIRYHVITGATPKEQRLRLVNEFNHDDVPVFLISLKAGGTGLNLIGADIVMVEPGCAESGYGQGSPHRADQGGHGI